MPSEMESELTVAPEPAIAKPVAGLYNLVKAWAQLPVDEAHQKLKLAVTRPESVLATNNKGSTGLHAAGYLRRWDLAKILLEAGADPLLKNLAGHDFYNQLVTTPKSPWKELLAQHPDLLAKQEEFVSARKKQHTEQREQKNLQKNNTKKSSKEIDGNESNSIHSESSKKQDRPKRKVELGLDDEAVEKLSHLDIIDLKGGMIPYSEAWNQMNEALQNHQIETLVEWIKSQQVHPAYDPDGSTLIQNVVKMKQRELLSAALNAGLSPKTPNRQGDTALHEAARLKQEDLAQLLLNAGAEASAKNAQGDTALSIACAHNDINMVERLLAFGANPNETMPDGERVINTVEKLGYFEIADILSVEIEHQPMQHQITNQSNLSIGNQPLKGPSKQKNVHKNASNHSATGKENGSKTSKPKQKFQKKNAKSDKVQPLNHKDHAASDLATENQKIGIVGEAQVSGLVSASELQAMVGLSHSDGSSSHSVQSSEGGSAQVPKTAKKPKNNTAKKSAGQKQKSQGNAINGANAMPGNSINKAKKPYKKTTQQHKGGAAGGQGGARHHAGFKQGRSSQRKSPLIANLSAMKEVDEFASYKAPKTSGPAPVIIVKKSRLLKPMNADGSQPQESPDLKAKIAPLEPVRRVRKL